MTSSNFFTPMRMQPALVGTKDQNVPKLSTPFCHVEHSFDVMCPMTNGDYMCSLWNKYDVLILIDGKTFAQKKEIVIPSTYGIGNRVELCSVGEYVAVLYGDANDYYLALFDKDTFKYRIKISEREWGPSLYPLDKNKVLICYDSDDTFHFVVYEITEEKETKIKKYLGSKIKSQKPVEHLSFDNSIIVFTTEDTLIFWDIISKKILKKETLSVQKNAYPYICKNKNTDQFFVLNGNNVSLWSASTYSLIKQYQPLNHPANSIKVLDDSTILVSRPVGSASTVTRYDATLSKVLQTYHGIHSLALLNQATTIELGFDPCPQLHFFNLNNPFLKHTLFAHISLTKKSLTLSTRLHQTTDGKYFVGKENGDLCWVENTLEAEYQPSPFFNLSSNLLLKITHFLPNPMDYLHLSQVCRSLRVVCTSDALSTKVVQLFKNHRDSRTIFSEILKSNIANKIVSTTYISLDFASVNSCIPGPSAGTWAFGRDLTFEHLDWAYLNTNATASNPCINHNGVRWFSTTVCPITNSHFMIKHDTTLDSSDIVELTPGITDNNSFDNSSKIKISGNGKVVFICLTSETEAIYFTKNSMNNSSTLLLYQNDILSKKYPSFAKNPKLALHLDDKGLVLLSNNEIYTYDQQGEKSLFKFSSPVTHSALIDKKTFIASTQDGTLFKFTSKQKIRKSPHTFSNISKIYVFKNKQIAIVSNQMLTVLDSHGEKIIFSQKFDGTVNDLTELDDQKIALATSCGTLTVFDHYTKKCLYSIHWSKKQIPGNPFFCTKHPKSPGQLLWGQVNSSNLCFIDFTASQVSRQKNLSAALFNERKYLLIEVKKAHKSAKRAMMSGNQSMQDGLRDDYQATTEQLMTSMRNLVLSD